VHVAYIYGSAVEAHVVAAGPASLFSANFGANPTSVCIDDERVYASSDASLTSATVRAYRITDGLLEWTFTAAFTAGAPSPKDVCCDGEYVYVVGATITDGAATYSVWCVSREGILVWRSQVGVDPESCCVDDRYLYVVDSNDELHMVDKRTGAVLRSDNGALVVGTNRAVDCDGVHIYAPSSTANYVRILNRGRTSQTWVRRSSTDVHRRPCYKLATPAGEQ
jgi:outer membrane protein assembly factor BamB